MEILKSFLLNACVIGTLYQQGMLTNDSESSVHRIMMHVLLGTVQGCSPKDPGLQSPRYNTVVSILTA